MTKHTLHFIAQFEKRSKLPIYVTNNQDKVDDNSQLCRLYIMSTK